MNDGCEIFTKMSSDGYPLTDTVITNHEVWPSKIWNHQDNYPRHSPATEFQISQKAAPVCIEEGMIEVRSVSPSLPQLSESHLYRFFDGVKGIGQVLAQNMVEALGTAGVVDALVNDPQKLTQVKNIKQKKLNRIIEHWKVFRKTLQPTVFES